MKNKDKVKVGDRIELVFINDTWTRLKPGDLGTIVKIESESDENLVWVQWDNGERLALLDPIDKFKVIKK
jgi:archaellum component FlaG (FlaF/FlaG flagellin family)